MVTQDMVDDFLSQQALAIVGVSRNNPNKWGNFAFRELRAKGYRMFIVHPNGGMIEGMQSYKSLAELPQKVDGVVIVVSPQQTEIVVQEAHASGIHRIWMQPGAESQAAIQFCEQNGMSVIHDLCIMVQASR